MKILAAIAIMAIAWASAAPAIEAADKTAKLSDPATTGSIELGATVREDRTRQTGVPRLPRHGFSSLEVKHIESAVRGQIQALAARDAGRAFDHPTPALQGYFADPRTFLQTLAQQVQPMVQAERFAFAGIDRDAVGAVQKVLLTGREGHQWLAEFKVQRQPDGSWRINGCQVEAARGQQT